MRTNEQELDFLLRDSRLFDPGSGAEHAMGRDRYEAEFAEWRDQRDTVLQKQN